MPRFQVVEKNVGSDWQQVRYQAYAIKPFDTEEEAMVAAKKYLTSVNMDNALASDEKGKSAEAFMLTADGVYLGELNGQPSYVKDRHKNVVKDRDYWELHGKTEVAVKPIPGT